MSKYIFIVAAVLTCWIARVGHPGKTTHASAPMGFNDPEDPASLANWNLMRLADPATGKIPENIRALELAFAERLPKNYSRSIGWQQIGPRDLGGRTRSAAFDVRNDSIMLAAGVSGGIWKSTNGGQSFYSVVTPPQLHSTTSLAQDKRAGKEDTWYAGTGEYYPVASQAAYAAPFSGNGIYKSTDNGETWTLLSSTMSNTPQTGYTNGDMDYVWRVVADFTNTSQDVVLAAVYNGIFRSDDGGSTWTPVLGVDTSTTATSDFVDLIQTSGGIFYAVLSSDGADKGIYRSDDGINWTNITDAGFPATYRRCVLTFNPQNDNEIMLLGETPGSGTSDHSLWKYTYVSGNGSGAGGLWENRSANIPTYTCTGFFTFDFGKFSSQSSYDLCIAWSPVDDSLVFLGGTNIYRSTNQFTSPATNAWIGGYRCYTPDLSQYVYPNHHPDQHGMLFYPNDGNRMLSFNDGGLYHSNNLLDTAVTWNTLNHHYITSQFYTIAMEGGNATSDYITCGAQDNGTWFTNANHLDSLWKWVGRGDGSYPAIPNGRAFYIASIQQGKVYKTLIDHFGDTTSPTRIDPNINNTAMFIDPLLLDPNDNNRMYLVQNLRIQRHDHVDQIPLTGEIYDTLQQGWTVVPNSSASVFDQAITAIEMSPAAPDVLFYGTAKGHLYKIIGASQPTTTKVAITSPLFPGGAYVGSISVNPFDANDMMVVFSNYRIRSIFHSKDGGITWSDISGNLEEFPDGTGSGPACYWAEIYPSWPTPTYFVGTSTGLYSTTQPDSTATLWTQEGPNTIGNVNVNMIVSRPYDGKIAIATHGNGIFTGYLTPAYLGVENKKPDAHYAEIYPNPSAGNSQISFNVTRSADVRITLHDLRGRKVAGLSLGRLQPGNHVYDLGNAISVKGNLTPGTYLVTLWQDETHVVKKWIIR